MLQPIEPTNMVAIVSSPIQRFMIDLFNEVLDSWFDAGLADATPVKKYDS
jgi:hypothetical protein